MNRTTSLSLDSRMYYVQRRHRNTTNNNNTHAHIAGLAKLLLRCYILMLSDVRVVVLENVNSYPFSCSCETVFAEVSNALLLRLRRRHCNNNRNFNIQQIQKVFHFYYLIVQQISANQHCN